jgi:hypothetical protein
MPFAIASVVFFVLGFIIFRTANKQKHDWKEDKSALIWGKPAKVIGDKYVFLTLPSLFAPSFDIIIPMNDIIK